jgi:hypothetical protein
VPTPNPSGPILDPTSVSSDWLTDALRTAGALPDGDVRSIEVLAHQQSTVATTTRLKVTYSPDAPTSAPQRLFLKTAHPTQAPDLMFHLGDREVRFYTHLAPATARVAGFSPIGCYSAVADPALGKWHVLLDDHSDTHTQPAWPLPPPLEQCRLAIDQLAALHARWWGNTAAATEALRGTSPLPWEMPPHQNPDDARLTDWWEQRSADLEAIAEE